jgi:hypothetical protein
MRRAVERGALAVACAILLLLPLRVGAAQASSDPARWRFTVTPYAWLTALSGQIGVRRVATSVDLSAIEVLRMLRFGAMATGEARHGPWLILADGIYASLRNGTAIAFRGDTGTFTYSQKEVIVQPSAGYTFGDDSWSIDALLGARYWYLGAGLAVDAARLPTTAERSDSRQWVDATGGARLRWRPDPSIQLVVAADAGGGGSRSTWQAYGSAEADAWHKVTIGVAYRVLAVDYDRQNFLFDTRTSGVIFGAKFHL